jgi:phosphoribosylanthranilate isomerase
VAEAFERHGRQPYAYDVSSGLEESPGVKSGDLMRGFFAELQRPAHHEHSTVQEVIE